MFKAKKDKAVWETIYESFNWQPGLEVSNQELHNIAGSGFKSFIPWVKKAIRESQGLVLKAVRGFGYQIISPEENIGAAKHHGRKARKQVKIANSIINHTDLKKLTPETRNLMEILAMNMSRLEHQMQFIVKRQVRVEQRTDSHAQEIATMKDRLAILEKSILKK